MKPYIEWTKEELVAEKARLEQEFAEVKAKGLNLNISRGKPAAAQLDLTEGMLTVLSKNERHLRRRWNRLPELRRADRYSGSKKTDRRYL